MPRVTSTVTNSVTCGAVNADAVMFCAVSLRTPFTGTRCSRDASKAAAAGPAASGAADTGTATGTATAAFTSARVIEPGAPPPPLRGGGGGGAGGAGAGERGQVDAEVPGELPHGRLGQDGPVPVGG